MSAQATSTRASNPDIERIYHDWDESASKM
jgi:hypothetical protein